MQLPLHVSPVSASFIGFMRLGIRLVLCVACSLQCHDVVFDLCGAPALSPPMKAGGRQATRVLSSASTLGVWHGCLVTDDNRQN